MKRNVNVENTISTRGLTKRYRSTLAGRPPDRARRRERHPALARGRGAGPGRPGRGRAPPGREVLTRHGRRLGLAAALIGDPGVLVLDEPVNGLDPEGIHWLRSLLKSLAAEGRAVFVSSHLISEMAPTAWW
jgi:hypothetical protein